MLMGQGWIKEKLELEIAEPAHFSHSVAEKKIDRNLLNAGRKFFPNAYKNIHVYIERKKNGRSNSITQNLRMINK